MNLVSCRNTLIYFETQAQEKALLRFQYALAHNSYLLLGSSESLGTLHKEFAVVNSKHKIYRILRPVTLPLDFKSSANRAEGSLPRISQNHRNRTWSSEAGLIENAQAQLMKHYSPPAVLVNENRELVHVYGDAQRYMQIPEGSVSLKFPSCWSANWRRSVWPYCIRPQRKTRPCALNCI